MSTKKVDLDPNLSRIVTELLDLDLNSSSINITHCAYLGGSDCLVA